MKAIIITCDKCNEVITGDHIEIGSESGNGFKFINNIGTTKIFTKYSDLHYCSNECFIDEFIYAPGGLKDRPC